jgi:hypothetical protein
MNQANGYLTCVFKWAALLAAIHLALTCVGPPERPQLAVVAAGLFVSAAILHVQERREKIDRRE